MKLVPRGESDSLGERASTSIISSYLGTRSAGGEREVDKKKSKKIYITVVVQPLPSRPLPRRFFLRDASCSLTRPSKRC